MGMRQDAQDEYEQARQRLTIARQWHCERVLTGEANEEDAKLLQRLQQRLQIALQNIDGQNAAGQDIGDPHIGA